MKTYLTCLSVLIPLLPSFSVRAGPILVETFTYPDGPLTTVSGGKWVSHSGTPGQADVQGGKLNLTDKESEDVNAPLQGAPYGASGSEVLYASFKLNFSALPRGAGTYFAHFKDAGTSNLRARVYAVITGAVPGAFRLGIANAGGAPVIIEQDLALNSTHTAVLRFDVAKVSATLWIDPAAETDPSVTGSDTGAAIGVTTFAFRQSLSGANGMGTLTVDDLMVAKTFDEALSALAMPPTISAHPVDQIVTAGQTARFTVQAGGAPPLAYQWKFGAAEISGATAPTLEIINAQPAAAGEYRVVISNPAGSVTSDPALLTVIEDPARGIRDFTVSRTNRGLRLSWAAEPGRAYTVLQAETVTGSFEVSAVGLVFDNEEGGWTDENLGNDRARFYKISTP